MTTTAEPTLDLAVGSPIVDARQLDALPQGSVVRWTRRSGATVDYTKNGERFVEDNGSSIPRDGFVLDGTNVIRSVGVTAPEVPDLHVGQTINTEAELSALPVGTQIATSSGRTTYTRTATGLIASPSGNVRTIGWLARRITNPLSVTRLPTPLPPVDTTVETVVEQETQFPVETLERFKQRFQTTVYSAQQSAGVSREPLNAAMRKLGVEHREVCIGMVVCDGDERLIQSIPAGSLLVSGEDPKQWHEYGVYGKKEGPELVHLLGGYTLGNYNIMRIVSIPGQTEAPEWVTAAASETEVDAIRAFMAQAWEVGNKAKSENSWCGEYESAMGRCGIDEKCALDPEPGMTAEQVAELPVGTILRVRSVLGQTALYRRDDSAENPAKTRRIGGVLEGSWAKDGMVVVFNPDTHAECSIPVATRDEMGSMPVGTVVGDGGSRWEKRADNYLDNPQRNWYAPGNSYGYMPGQFSPASIAYKVIPS